MFNSPPFIYQVNSLSQLIFSHRLILFTRFIDWSCELTQALAICRLRSQKTRGYPTIFLLPRPTLSFIVSFLSSRTSHHKNYFSTNVRTFLSYHTFVCQSVGRSFPLSVWFSVRQHCLVLRVVFNHIISSRIFQILFFCDFSFVLFFRSVVFHL